MAALQRVALNFPDLGSEVRYMQHEHVPGVGDRFRGRGRDWIVESVTYENEHAVVTLRAPISASSSVNVVHVGR